MSIHRPPKFNAGELNVYSNPDDVSEVSRALRHTGRRVMLVPTMGALHDGHLALVRAAKRVPGSVVVVSIFVNPLQFGADEDLDGVPAGRRGRLGAVARRRSRNSLHPKRLRRCIRTARVPPCTPGHSDPNSRALLRPTHFAGMLTVVCKLLQIVAPDRIFFGEKDYQQLVLVRQMVADLNVDVRVVGVPIVRETDGLAMSSRNRYLNAAQRELAGVLSAALLAGTHAAPGGAEAALQAARAVLSEVPAIDVDYLEVARQRT